MTPSVVDNLFADLTDQTDFRRISTRQSMWGTVSDVRDGFDKTSGLVQHGFDRTPLLSFDTEAKTRPEIQWRARRLLEVVRTYCDENKAGFDMRSPFMCVAGILERASRHKHISKPFECAEFSVQPRPGSMWIVAAINPSETCKYLVTSLYSQWNEAMPTSIDATLDVWERFIDDWFQAATLFQEDRANASRSFPYVDGRGVDGRGVDGRGVDGRGVDGRGVDVRGADRQDRQYQDRLMRHTPIDTRRHMELQALYAQYHDRHLVYASAISYSLVGVPVFSATSGV